MKKVMLSILSIVLLVSCGNSNNTEVKEGSLPSKKIEVISTQQSKAIVQQSKLVKSGVLGGELTILLPDYFGLMSEELVNVKYPSGSRPTEIYSNESGTVSIGFNHTQNQMELEKLPKLLPAFVEQFSNMYPTIKWYKKEVRKIHGVDYVLLEFETPAIDTEIYNLMAITVLDGRMLISTFNCTVGVKSEWKDNASQIINSLQIMR